jgi:hypothetical protein
MSNARVVDFIGKDFWYLTQTSQRASKENIFSVSFEPTPAKRKERAWRPALR